MKVIHLILNAIKKVEYVLLVAILAAIVLSTFLQVIGRHTPLPFSSKFEELATFSFVWVTMIGAGTCVREGGHMSMDFMVSFVPENKRVFFKLLNDVVALLIGVAIIYCAAMLIPKLRRTGMTSAAMDLPLWIQNLSIPVGGALISLWGSVNIIEDIKRIAKKEPLSNKSGAVKEE